MRLVLTYGILVNGLLLQQFECTVQTGSFSVNSTPLFFLSGARQAIALWYFIIFAGFLNHT